MAIDTRERRASTAGFNLAHYGHGATPQASFPQSERQAVLWTYAGIAAANPAPGTVVISLAGEGGLAGHGGLAGRSGGLAG